MVHFADARLALVSKQLGMKKKPLVGLCLIHFKGVVQDLSRFSAFFPIRRHRADRGWQGGVAGADQAARSASFLNVIRWSASLPEAAGRTVEIQFALYQDKAGGIALWNESQRVNVGADGKCSVLLGAARAEGLPAALFQAGQARWIEAKLVGAASEDLSEAGPRALLAAVPYAFKPTDAETLAGRAAADYVTKEDLQSAVAATAQTATAVVHPNVSLTGSGTAGYIPLWTSSSNLGNSVMAETGISVGIDTATPGNR
jgi:hypothetical protein